MIPRTFHRIWIDEPIPERYEAYWQSFQDMHPGWEFRTWNDSAELLEFMQNAELFSSFTQKPEMYGLQSDIARYEIINRFGGVYVDTDVEPVRPFDQLIEGPDADFPFIAWCSEAELDPSIFGSPAGHPAVRLLVDELGKILPHVGQYLSPPGTTGPAFVTRNWRARTDVRRLIPATFFPYHWSDPHEQHARPPWPAATIAVHRWSAGWKPKQPRPAPRRVEEVTVREPVWV